MKPHLKLDIHVGTFREMTDEQFHALKDNILADGLWENLTAVDDPIRISGGGDYIGVYLPNLFVGIEKDGYTHS